MKVTPTENYSEVFDEANDHQFFFSSSGSSSFLYSDQDDNGNPLGLSFEVTTGNAANETFTFVLSMSQINLQHASSVISQMLEVKQTLRFHLM